MEFLFTLTQIVYFGGMIMLLIVGLRMMTNENVLKPLQIVLIKQQANILTTVKTVLDMLTTETHEDRNFYSLTEKLKTDLTIFAHSMEKNVPVPYPNIPAVFRDMAVLGEAVEQLDEDIKTYNLTAKKYMTYWEQERKTLPLGKMFTKFYPKVELVPVRKGF